jgi:hypothetical protein
VTPTSVREPRTVACAARPYTSFVHVDEPCQCFYGGPAPVHAPTPAERAPAGVRVDDGDHGARAA